MVQGIYSNVTKRRKVMEKTVVDKRWIQCCTRPSSFLPLMLGVSAGRVDRLRDVRRPSVSAVCHICSGVYELNSVEIHLEVERKQVKKK